MKELIAKLLDRNRTIVTQDNQRCMEIIGQDYPIDIHRFATDEEHGTWVIPPEWNLKSASLSRDGDIIVSHEDCKLFVAAYSLPFSGTVTKEELLEHCFTVPANPESFNYEFRLAYNYQLRLKDWRLSVPFNTLQALPDGSYDVEINVEVKPGHMLIGEYLHEGTSGYSFDLLSHYCHTAQANDGLCGVATMLEVVDRLKTRHPNPVYSYRALVMPETIGSSVFVSANEHVADKSIGAVFSEMGGADAPLQLVQSRRADTYIDRIFQHVLTKRDLMPVRTVPFRKGWGNDEMVFDSPGVNVPGVSLDRYPFAAYHTHYDNMDLVHEDRLEEVVDILLQVADEFERDFIPQPQQRVPVYLSRFDLYSDWTYERGSYDDNLKIIDGMWSGLSVTDNALKIGVDVDYAHAYVKKLVEQDLVRKLPVSPKYSKRTQFDICRHSQV